MHLDTVFTLLDRDKATAYPKVVDEIRAISLRPGPDAGRLPRDRGERLPRRRRRRSRACEKLHVVETGGDAYQQEREQWDDGNNVVALEPGVVVAYERNTYTIAKMRQAGVEVIEIAGLRAREGPRRRSLHDLPAPRETRCRRSSTWRRGESDHDGRSRHIATDTDRPPTAEGAAGTGAQVRA